MMKFVFVVIAALVANTFAASIGQTVLTEKREIVPLLKFETEKEPNGNFHFSYEGGDGSSRTENGVLTNVGAEDEALEVSGSYRYIDADGQEIEVHYTAGKNGFVPIGTNIPKSISALAQAAADLPNYSEEEEARKLKQRKARSQVDEVEKVDKVQVKHQPAETQNVPVQVVVEEPKNSKAIKA